MNDPSAGYHPLNTLCADPACDHVYRAPADVRVNDVLRCPACGTSFTRDRHRTRRERRVHPRVCAHPKGLSRPMTRPLYLALLAVLSCTQTRDALVTASGAETLVGPCATGAQVCHDSNVWTCGANRQWGLAPVGARCLYRCVADPRPRCAGPLLDAGADVLVLAVTEASDAEVSDGE